jgi:hypothetical protein
MSAALAGGVLRISLPLGPGEEAASTSPICTIDLAAMAGTIVG